MRILHIVVLHVISTTMSGRQALLHTLRHRIGSNAFQYHRLWLTDSIVIDAEDNIPQVEFQRLGVSE
jgi:hypothetical protein